MANEVRLFLCGDVMLGRGVDQILAHHVHPQIFEGYMKSAVGYVDLAIEVNGPFPENRATNYVWGTTLKEFERLKPDLRIINLETSITDRGSPWPGKGIQYRMHPKNVDVLSSAKIDVCSLANNHVLDWGYLGLSDTIAALKSANIQYPGAGESEAEATAPSVITLPSGQRVIVVAFGDDSSGIYPQWAADKERAGVNVIELSGEANVRKVKAQIDQVRQEGDIVVATIHQGGNWGYRASTSFQVFARSLIDTANVDLVHCHSSHHPKGLTVHKGKLIIWGCGDYITDYEGITGQHDEYRGELSFMYFPSLERGSGQLKSLTLVPTILRHFSIHLPERADREWLFNTMKRECNSFGTDLVAASEDLSSFRLTWNE